MYAPSPKRKPSQRIQIYHARNRDYKWKFNSHFILWTPYHQFLTWGWKALIRNHDQDYAPIQATFSENMQERCVSLHPFSSTVQTISMFRWSAYHCGWTQGYLFSKKNQQTMLSKYIVFLYEATRICWGITFEGNNCSTHDRHNSSSMPSSFHS